MNTYTENSRSQPTASGTLWKGLVDDDRTDKLFAVKYPLRVLIADDNLLNRRMLGLALQRLGYTADTVENGLDCLSATVMGSYDLVLMDIHMPMMDGLECTRAIRETGSEISIVAVTSTSPEDARLECFNAGMNGYMEKPVHAAELKAALRLAFLGHMFAAA